MIPKLPYIKPQSELVWLPAPAVLVGTSGVTEGTPGTWNLNPFSGSFNDPLGIQQSVDDFLL